MPTAGAVLEEDDRESDLGDEQVDVPVAVEVEGQEGPLVAFDLAAGSSVRTHGRVPGSTNSAARSSKSERL